MTFKEIEEAALKLPDATRAELVQRLILSFQRNEGGDDQNARSWVEEALRRDQHMTKTADEGIPAEAVFRELRARRRSR